MGSGQWQAGRDPGTRELCASGGVQPGWATGSHGKLGPHGRDMGSGQWQAGRDPGTRELSARSGVQPRWATGWS